MIIYAFVSRRDVVLVEHSKASGNFVQISRMLLAKIDPVVDTKQCYETGDHFFYYIVSNGLIFLCIADKSTSVTRAFAFLNEVRTNFLQKFGSRVQTASAFSLSDEFERSLSTLMVCYAVQGACKPGKGHSFCIHLSSRVWLTVCSHNGSGLLCIEECR